MSIAELNSRRTITSIMNASSSTGTGGSSGSGRAVGDQPIAINIETLRLQISSWVARVRSRVSVDTLRPLPVFLGLNPVAGFCLRGAAFTPPVTKLTKTTHEKIRSRVSLNFAYFLTNYVLLASMVALVVSLMHPGMVFFLAIVYGLWSLHSFLIRNKLELFGVPVHALLTIQQRFYLLLTITSVVVVWKCLAPTLIFLAISGILILSHAFLRDPKDVEAASSGSNHGDNSDDDEDIEAGAGGSGSSNESEVLVERPRRREK